MATGDPNFYAVQLLLHGDTEPLKDSSYYARNLLLFSNAYQVFASSYTIDGFDQGYYLQGNNNYGLKQTSPAYLIGSSDFTFELFVSPVYGGHYNYGDSVIFQLGTNATAGMFRLMGPDYINPGSLRLQGHNGSTYVNLTPITPTFPSLVFKHVAVTRAGSVWSIWLDGVLAAQSTVAYDVTQTNLFLFSDSDGRYGYSGTFDEIRFTVGVARYTANFTPPSAPFPNRPVTWEFAFNETMGVGNEGLGYKNQYIDTLTEQLNVQSILAFIWGIQWQDSYEFRDTMNTRLPVRLTDRVSTPDLVSRAISFGQSTTDGAAVGDALSRVFRPGASVLDQARVLDAMTGSGKFNAAAIDTNVIRDALALARTALLTEGVGAQDVMTLQRGVYVTDRLGLNEVWAAAAKMGVTQTDRVAIADLLRRFFGGEAVDSTTIGDALANRLRAAATPTDTVGMQDVLSKQLVLRAVTSETAQLSDVQLLKMIMRPALLDAFELSAAFVSSGGDVTTWAINVVNGAVTEYGNYSFNSFAQLGNKYLGAAPSGLYELNGDSDDGEAIIARIKSGLLQMAGSHFTQFKGAYLGVRGEGEFILRLITGDDEVYDYGFTADSMRSTRVVLGKGLRARYFAFELLTEGQDFDIDTIEFVPLMNSRRV